MTSCEIYLGQMALIQLEGKKKDEVYLLSDYQTFGQWYKRAINIKK